MQQSVIDEAIGQWRKRLKACVKANERHVKHLLQRFVYTAFIQQNMVLTNKQTKINK